MPLQSHPVPTAGADEEIDEDEECKIKVSQAPGYLCHIAAHVTIRLPADTLWKQCIVHPHNAKIYRHMDKCTYRRVLSTEPDGQRKVQVAHEASWRFLMFSGKFTTHLLVQEDHVNHIMKFELLPRGSSIVNKFQGQWKIDPHPQDPHCCISTLEQDISLGVWMPPPFDRIMKSISCRQVRRIVQDLQAEAKKINSGRPTLVPYATVADEAIGNEEPQEEENSSSGGSLEKAPSSAFKIEASTGTAEDSLNPF